MFECFWYNFTFANGEYFPCLGHISEFIYTSISKIFGLISFSQVKKVTEKLRTDLKASNKRMIDNVPDNVMINSGMDNFVLEKYTHKGYIDNLWSKYVYRQINIFSSKLR